MGGSSVRSGTWLNAVSIGQRGDTTAGYSDAAARSDNLAVDWSENNRVTSPVCARKRTATRVPHPCTSLWGCAISALPRSVRHAHRPDGFCRRLPTQRRREPLR